MNSLPLSELLPWKDRDSFWDLYRRLGERYEADMKGSSSTGKPVAQRIHTTDGAPKPGTALGLLEVRRPSPLSPLNGGAIQRPSTSELPRLDANDQVSESSSLNILPSPQADALLEISQQMFHNDTGSHFFTPLLCWSTKAKFGRTGARDTSKTRAETTSAVKTATPMAASCTLSPTGHFRNLWDFMGIVLLTLDTIILPLQFVNEKLYEEYPLIAVNSRVAVFFWLTDIVLSFFTGYLQKGNLVQSRRRIFWHYVRSWFLPDVLVTVIDLFLEFSSNTESRASTRILRLLRLFRVVRLGKLTRFAAFLRDKFETQVASIQFTLTLLILGMMLLEHIVACGWFGLGIMEKECTWLQKNDLLEASFYLQYVAALRWAFAHLGIGGTNIEATNEREGTYGVVVSLISLVTFSSIISSMTSLVSALQSRRMEETQQFGLLRRFLRINKIPVSLGHRITRFLQYTYHQRAVAAHDPYILDYLSKALQAELQFARYSECLSRLPFLDQLVQNDSMSVREGHILQTLAQRAVAVLDSAEDDVVFCSGFRADATYYAVHGALSYYQKDHAPERVRAQWVSEMCLWTEWSHTGDLFSTSFAKLVAINVQEFCTIISSAATVQAQAHEYAVSYVLALNTNGELSDLWSPTPVTKHMSMVKDRWQEILVSSIQPFRSLWKGSSLRVAPSFS